MKPLAYYAHSKLDYNTEREEKELNWLKEQYQVLNPNTHIGERGEMAPYLGAIQACHCVVVSCHEGDFVGKGCFHEVCFALAIGRPVHCLVRSGDDIELIKVIGVALNKENDWKVRYGRIFLDTTP